MPPSGASSPLPVGTENRIKKWQNGKQYNRKTNSAQSTLVRWVRQGCTGSSATPLTPLLHRVAAKFLFSYFLKIFAKFFNSCFAKFDIQNYLSKFCASRNFDKIILNFTKFEETFAKLEIKNVAKISRNYENEKFRSHPTPTQSAVCYSPSPPVC